MIARYLFLLVYLLCCNSLTYAATDEPALKQLRKKLILAIDNSHITDSLYNVLGQQNKTPLNIAYMGALDALKAKHNWNPYNKIKYLNVSGKLMQQAVANDPHNIEIRFMRFSIQHNVPGFLGFSKDLVTDREEMINQINHKNYGTADKELTLSIINFLITSKRCTEFEKNNLRKQLTTL